VTPTEKLIDKPLVRGGTSVLAYVNKVGGSTCRAEIHLSSGQKISAKVKKKALAEELGRLLYRQVELRGIATYRSETMEMREFEIQDIGRYSGDDPAEAIQTLAEFDGERWGSVDVVGHVEKLRHNGDCE